MYVKLENSLLGRLNSGTAFARLKIQFEMCVMRGKTWNLWKKQQMKVLRFEIPKFDNYQAFRTLYNIYHPLYKSTVAKTVSLYKFLHLVNSKHVPTFGQSIKISTFQPLLESRLKFVISSPQLKRNSPKTFEAITVQILPTLPFTTLL